jgi:uncharacterized protein (DUF58 family)
MNRLTRSGWILLGSGPLLAVSGFLAGYAFLAGAGLAALAAVACAVVITLARYRVSAERVVTPDRVTVGGQVRMGLVVHNLSGLPTPGFAATVEIGQWERIELPVPSLGPRGRVEVSAMVTASRRGKIPLSPVAIRRRDPLGLAERDAGFSDPDWLWVHPRVHHVAPLPTGLVLDFEGRASDRAHAGSATFASLREYARGDDPRHIHWRTTARTGVLTVRHHVDTTEPTANVVLDTRVGVLEPQQFEQAIEIAASIVAASARTGRPYSLSGVDLEEGTADYLDRLASVTQSDTPLAGLIGVIERTSPGGSLAVISGDVPGLIERIAPQRRRFALVVAILVGAQGTGLHRRPGMTVVSVTTAAEFAGVWPAALRGAA